MTTHHEVVRPEPNRYLAVLEWLATAGPVLAVMGQGLAILLGSVGFVWGLASEGFYRLFFGLSAIVLGILAPRITKVVIDFAEGVITANTKRRRR